MQKKITREKRNVDSLRRAETKVILTRLQSYTVLCPGVGLQDSCALLGTTSLYNCSFLMLSNNIIEPGYDKGCLFSPGSTSHVFWLRYISLPNGTLTALDFQLCHRTVQPVVVISAI